MSRIFAWLDRIFSISRYGSTPRREIVAGITTFMSMAYIFAVNPAMLAETGMPREAAFAATVWASALPTLIMAFGANLPLVLAPGMGVNAFFTYTLVMDLGLSWQSALAAVVLSGLLFLICALTPVMRYIMDAVPEDLKLAIGAGIGLFIAVIGFQNSGLIVADPDTMLALGNLASLPVLLCLAGLLLTAFLMIKGLSGAILLGMLAVTLAGMLLGQVAWPAALADVFSLRPPSLRQTLFQLDFGPVLTVSFMSVLFTMVMVDMFNAIGTIIGVSGRAGLLEKDTDGHQRPRGLKPALIADSSGTIIGGLLGTSPVTSYMESITGIAAGGRTGLTGLTAAALILLCLFFAPLLNLIPAFATAPALIMVGALMLADIGKINFDSLETGLPAFLAITAMPLTSSIVNGFGLGFISYSLLQILLGKFRSLHPAMLIISLLFGLHFYLALQ